MNAALLAGDIDFQPLIEALVREGMKVKLWCSPQASDDLVGAADWHQTLSNGSLLYLFLVSSGISLVPRSTHGTRPHPIESSDFSWQCDSKEIIIRRFADEWLAERFDPAALATSDQLFHTDPNKLINAIFDLWDVKISEDEIKRAKEIGGY